MIGEDHANTIRESKLAVTIGDGFLAAGECIFPGPSAESFKADSSDADS